MSDPFGSAGYNPLLDSADLPEPAAPAPVPEPVTAANANPPTPRAQVPPKDAAAAAPAVDEPEPAPAPATAAAEPDPATDTGTAGAAPTEAARPVAEPDPALEAERERERALAAYARRRRRYSAGLIALVVAGLWLVKPWDTLATQSGPSPTPSASAQAAHVPAGSVSQDLKTIHDTLAKDGALDALTLPGARVAAAGSTAYVARQVADGQGSQCLVYAVIDGADTDPAPDPSGSACTDPAQIAGVQAALDAEASAQRVQQDSDAVALLRAGAESAAFIASRTYVDGKPTMSSITDSDVAPAHVAERGPTWLRLEATSGATCRTAVINIDGQLGETTPC